MTIDERVDAICKWNNPGLRAAVFEAMQQAVIDLELENARLRTALGEARTMQFAINHDYIDLRNEVMRWQAEMSKSIRSLPY